MPGTTHDLRFHILFLYHQSILLDFFSTISVVSNPNLCFIWVASKNDPFLWPKMRFFGQKQVFGS